MAFFIELGGSESDATGSCISVGSKMETIAFVKYLDILGHNLLRLLLPSAISSFKHAKLN